MRVFVNNVDGFLAGAVCADLWGLSHNIVGTQKGCAGDPVPPMLKRKLVPRLEVRRLLKAVAACDVIVYDLHDADLEELELVLRTLHSSELSHEAVLILISSVGVWARTQREFELVPGPEEDAEAEAEAPLLRRPVALRCEDYIRRVPAPKFQEWKAAETLALALKERGTVRPYVVCAGIPYGNGEEPFLGLFQAAWQGRDTLRVVGHGQNFVPTVHARDVARLVRRLVQERPSLDYHLAVDRGELTQRELVQAVADEFGAGPVGSVSVAEAMLAELADVLTLDLRLEPSPLMAAAQAEEHGHPVADDAEGAAPFRWWCEKGLAANVANVAAEFCRWRCLSPVRLIVLGPPGSGTEDLGALLARHYNVPAVRFEDVVEEQRAAEGPLGQQLRERLDEIATATANPKSTGPFFLPSSLTVELVEAALTAKPALYRGFVLCGYPQTLDECNQFLLEDAPPPEPEEPEEGSTAESPPPEPPAPAPAPVPAPKASAKGAEPPPVPATPEPERVPRASMAPDAVVLLARKDDACLRHLQAGERPVVEREFQLKMDRWKKENPEDAPALEEIFREKFECAVVNIDANEVTFEDEILKVAGEVEQRREVINFLPPAQVETAGPVEEEACEEPPPSTEENARAEAELRKRTKEQEERLEQIKREEHARLEKHSEPLRQYMTGFVVPTLTTGLVEVCRKQPDDPVGYLAEYLSVYSELVRQQGKRAFKPAVV